MHSVLCKHLRNPNVSPTQTSLFAADKLIDKLFQGVTMKMIRMQCHFAVLSLLLLFLLSTFHNHYGTVLAATSHTDSSSQTTTTTTSSDQSAECSANDPDTTASSSFETKAPPDQPELYSLMGSYELLQIVPHDPRAFTQGLELKNSTHMYESVGMYGESRVRIVEITTGAVTRETALPDKFFAEGMTLVRHPTIIPQAEEQHASKPLSSSSPTPDELILLTWKEQTAFRLDPESLEVLGSFSYQTTNGEGWGVAYDGKDRQLYVTDGTHNIHVWDSPETSGKSSRASTYRPTQEVRRQEVTFQLPQQSGPPQKLGYLNELEWDSRRQSLLANVWYQNVLVRIHPTTGFVQQIYNLQSLRPPHERGSEEDCLNGIAIEDESIHTETIVWVTGKYWPYMYRIKLIDGETSKS